MLTYCAHENTILLLLILHELNDYGIKEKGKTKVTTYTPTSCTQETIQNSQGKAPTNEAHVETCTLSR
jgi:hypothetical protein